jgi:hypothetical protein
VGLSIWPTAHVAAPTRALRVLEPKAFQVLVAVARRVVPMDDADHVAIAHGIDDALMMMPPEARDDINDLLGLFENALPGLLLDGRTAPFTRLGAAAQDHVLEAWRDSRIVLRRGGYHGLRRLCLAGYYKAVSAWPAVHYAGPPDTAGFFHDDSLAGTPGWAMDQEPTAKKEGAPP